MGTPWSSSDDEPPRAEECARLNVKYLIAHGVNDPQQLATVLPLANGIELDLRSDNRTWYVNHNTPTGTTLPEYLGRLNAASPFPELVYLDIKTPAASNLEALPGLLEYTVTRHPDVQIVYGAAHNAKELARLPHDAVLGIDCAFFNDSQTLNATFPRHRFWVGDGNLPRLPAFSVETTLTLARTLDRCVGTYVWTYRHMNTLRRDMARLQCTAVTIEPDLLPQAANLLRTCRCPYGDQRCYGTSRPVNS